MRALNESLSEHLNSDVTTLCHAWRLTRSDGIILGFTDHDEDLTFDQTIFQSTSGFAPSSARTELGLNADDQEVAGAFSSDQITEKDLTDGRYDGAKVEVFLVNWEDVRGFVKLRTQELGEVSYGASMFRAELRSLAHRLDQTVGRVFSKRCGADLGDSACSVEISNAQYQASGAILSADSDQTCTVDGLASFADGWFKYGFITFKTGDNAGLSMEIHDHVIEDANVNLTLFAPMANIPQAGDTFIIIAGCDKTSETCASKFGNILNFQGFPHMPGSDFAYGYADGETVHDGRVLVS